MNAQRGWEYLRECECCSQVGDVNTWGDEREKQEEGEVLQKEKACKNCPSYRRAHDCSLHFVLEDLVFKSEVLSWSPPSKLTWCQRPNIGRAGQLLESLSTQVELQISRSHCSTAFKVGRNNQMWIRWYVRIFMESVVILFSIAVKENAFSTLSLCLP